jgi:hypothetical protein
MMDLLKNSFEFIWDDNFSIETKVVNDSLIIKANKAGLLSLARHLQALAQDNVPNHYHLHLDDSNAFEDGSVEIIIEKVNT